MLFQELENSSLPERAQIIEVIILPKLDLPLFLALYETTDDIELARAAEIAEDLYYRRRNISDEFAAFFESTDDERDMDREAALQEELYYRDNTSSSN